VELSVEKNRFIEGASQGFLYPSVMAVLHVQATSKGKLAGNLEHSLIAAIPHANAHLSEVAADDHQAEALLAATLLITHDILLYFDYPSERLPTFHSDDLGEHHCIASVQISCLSSRAFIAALKIAWSALQRAAKGGAPLDLKHPRLKSLVMQLRADAPQGFNTKHLLLEAQSRQIPWVRIWANTFQLGYGCYARLFDSSVSDSTSKIGTELVRNKIATNTFLMAAGFPVMTSKIVTSAEMAVQEAIKMSPPVVIKPVSTEGGVGVFALLYQESEIISAFEEAQKLSRMVIIEPFFEGKDYRVHVVNGKVHGIVERQPASVVADGTSSIAQLIVSINNERAQATDDRQYLHEIKLNAETERVCALQGYQLKDIPPANSEIRLSAICNVATGGQPIERDISVMHADNEALCIDVAQLLRLDIAGVDLMISDIGISWRESGAHICEVNHKPQMFTSFFPEFLESYFPASNGRIPIYLVMERDDESPVSKIMVKELEESYENVCWLTDSVVRTHTYQGVNNVPLMQTAKSALMNTKTDAMVLTLSPSVSIETGWSFSHCDRLILVPHGKQTVQMMKETKLYQEIVSTLKPAKIDVMTPRY